MTDSGRSLARLVVALAVAAGAALPQTLAAARDGGAGGPVPEGAPPIALTRLSTGIGLTSTFTKGNTHTGGGCWIDYNGDLWPDLFLTNGSGLEHFLYRNDGDGTFTDVSALVPKPDPMLEDAGAVFGDVDNDGDEDLLVAVDNPFLSLDLFNPIEGGPNLLYLNDGDGGFVEAGVGSGFDDPLGRRNNHLGLADFDRDGVLDVFVGHWQLNSPDGIVNHDRLLRGDGDGTFTDVSDERRVDAYGRDTLVSLWFDANLDDWPDLYVGAVGGGVPEPDNNDVYYQNETGDAPFCDRTGDPHVIGDDAKAAMGMDVGDIDADGDWDFYVTDVIGMGAEPFGNVLYLGNGDGTFADNTCDVAGVCAFNSWPCNFVDLDLDGWTDLWVGTGDDAVADFVYRNEGDGTFTDVTPASMIGNAARGGALADYDGDGDVDLFVQNHDGDSVVYRNDTASTRHWLALRLVGTVSNRSAIGALVHLEAGGLEQMRRVSGGDSAHSQSELAVHFGLGLSTVADVRVHWPSGQQDLFTGVAADRFYLLDEDLGIVPETIEQSEAVHDAAAQTLTVNVRTSYAGRSTLSVTGYGSLAYDVEKLGHARVFGGVVESPGTVDLVSAFGGSWTLTVDDE